MKFTEFAIRVRKDAATKIIKEHTLRELSLSENPIVVSPTLAFSIDL